MLLLKKRKKTMNKDLRINLLKKIDDLELSARSRSTLKSENIIYVFQLIQKTESDLLCNKNFGRRSLLGIEWVLKKMDLSLGMDIPIKENVNMIVSQIEIDIRKIHNRISIIEKEYLNQPDLFFICEMDKILNSFDILGNDILRCIENFKIIEKEETNE